MSDTKYYKVLVEGRSPHMRTPWSLPVRGVPGDWMSVEGELFRCNNGLHLTSDPIGIRSGLVNAQCYLAETEGETIGPYNGHELVARKVRLVKRVAWSDLKWVDPEPDVDPQPKQEPKTSPALELLTHVWKHEGHGLGQSWGRVNDAMGSALKLAIKAGLRFDPDDFKTFSKDFRSGRWIGDAEWCYSRACGGEYNDHGGNPSAVQSFEAWRGRKPFIVRFEPNDKTPKRLYVGAQFKWADKGELRLVHVTSFNDTKQTCIAVEYEPGSNRSKISRRHTITHDKIKEYHSLLRESEKQPAENEVVSV